MRISLCSIALVGLVAASSVASAAGPEADPNKEYWLSANDGPYLVFVASFRGDEARELANKLVFELRSRYGRPAFVYSRSEEERAAQKKWLEDMHTQYGENQRFKKVRIVDDFAVLVGHWKDMDAARADLDKIKKSPPPESVGRSGIVFISDRKKRPDGSIDYRAQAGVDKPFSQAFVSRNPLAPKEVAKHEGGKQGKLDPVWMEMNSKEKYSLFKCQKPWTLVVQVYQGASVTMPAPKPSFMDKARPGAREEAMERQLRLSAKSSGKDMSAISADAVKLADLLRDKGRGYEAYVFHTRDASLVTVGGFRAPNDPELLRLQKQLAGMNLGQLKLLDSPVPFEVPKP